jgi:quinolinate synthase
MNFAEEIEKLKKEKNAVILSHYYQYPEIQDIADYVGDSLGLSKQAADTNADMIVFAGVHFMAETAKIINPSKTVVLPDLNAGCSLSDSCPSENLQDLKDKYPNHIVVSYINCSADVKAISDIICTSSNAIRVVESISKDKEIIFAPDKNLGRYVSDKTNRDMILWDGTCEVHIEFSNKKIAKIQKEYPNAKLIAHPESQQQILDQSDFIGSTSSLLDYVQTDDTLEYIVATEVGILHKMKQFAPHKKYIPAPITENNTCACGECPYMKLNTLEKIYNCMKNESAQISVDEDVRTKAKKAIDNMLALG